MGLEPRFRAPDFLIRSPLSPRRSSSALLAPPFSARSSSSDPLGPPLSPVVFGPSFSVRPFRSAVFGPPFSVRSQSPPHSPALLPPPRPSYFRTSPPECPHVVVPHRAVRTSLLVRSICSRHDAQRARPPAFAGRHPRLRARCRPSPSELEADHLLLHRARQSKSARLRPHVRQDDARPAVHRRLHQRFDDARQSRALSSDST